MKYLIIPDIHNHYDRAEKIIKSVNADQIIFLGDYFDDFDDNRNAITEVAKWFSWSIHEKNRIHLCGNHDIHYWFKDNKDQRCGGWEQYKSTIINDIVKPEDWNKLKFFHVLDDWILSHAGVHSYWLDPVKSHKSLPVEITKDQLIKKLERGSEECVKLINQNRHHWFTIAGFSRSGSPFVGGLLWLDFNEEFCPIQGIHQIVGHTPDRYNVKWKFFKENDTIMSESTSGAEPVLSDKSSYNVCIDSYPALKWYAIYEDKKLIIKEFKNL